MKRIFSPRTLKCNLRKQNSTTQKIKFPINSVNSSKYGLNSLRFFASKVWQMILMEIKNLKRVSNILRAVLGDENQPSVIVNSVKTTMTFEC